MVNAGDGKHEHPSQALLDVYTLRGRLGELDGKRIWIVGDVLQPRPRSCASRFKLMGEHARARPGLIRAARPSRCGSTSIAGCGSDVVSRCGLARADERDSCPRSASTMRFQVDGRRLGPRQLLTRAR